MDKPMRFSQRALKAEKWEFLWLCGLILSFAYERPLIYLTSMDRANPRLFDLIFLIGLIMILPRLRRNVRVPSLLRIWAAIVAVFCVCSLIWVVGILPWERGVFSLYYAVKYLEGLAVLYIAVKIPLNSEQKRKIHYLIVVGGIFVACYCVSQYGTLSKEVQIAADKFANIRKGVIAGPMGGITYLHLAMFSAVSCVMTAGLAASTRGTLSKLLYAGLALFVAWPAFLCGSRLGLGIIAVAIPVLALFSPSLGRYKNCFIVLAIGAVVLFLLLYGNPIHLVDSESNLSVERLIASKEGGANSIRSRLLLFKDYTTKNYKWKGRFVPFIGAGFYVAPLYDQSGNAHYRVGYGVHNSYLFAFEQGGVVAFILFIAFLIRCWQDLNKTRRSDNIADSAFAAATLACFTALLFVAMTGIVFWLGFGTGHMSVCLLLILVVASRPACVVLNQRSMILCNTA